MQEAPDSLVLLLSDFSAALHSDRALIARRAALNQQAAQQQQQQPPQESGSSGSSGSIDNSEPTAAQDPSTKAAEATGSSSSSSNSSSSACCTQDVHSLSTELHAVETALAAAIENLTAIYQDTLLAGELSAVGGYWLLRRFLPALQQQPPLVLTGLCALPGLRYKVSGKNAVCFGIDFSCWLRVCFEVECRVHSCNAAAVTAEVDRPMCLPGLFYDVR
jgi:hypothetical protein